MDKDTSQARLTRPPGWRRAALAAVIPLVLLATFAGSAAARATSPQAASGGLVSYALPAGNTPNYIFPLTPGADSSVLNLTDFQPLLYSTLYYYQTGSHIKVNPGLSLAEPPSFAVRGGHTVVTITLKTLDWSDGQPITTRDVEFWMNLVKANVSDWYAAVPGSFPYNVIGQDYINAHTFTLTFNGVYNDYWLLYNELLQVTPIPQHAWDRTSASGPIGNYDRTPAGAREVYKYLNLQSQALGSYATSPLWKVVDGPWNLSSFDASTGFTVFTRNSSFRGPGPRPSVGTLELVPFTSDTAEFDALRSGAIDYGYLPIQDVSQKGVLARSGYRISPEIGWATTFMPLNYTNTLGAAPILKQLYVRQAMQHLIDQPAYIRAIFKGYATACYGPVPCAPTSQFLNPAERDAVYPYDPRAAVHLLQSHGWAVHPDSTSTCSHPGAGPADCGAGIKKGAPLSFTLLYDSGYLALEQEMEAVKSSFSAAGIQLQLSTAPFDTVIGEVDPCSKSNAPTCHWEIGNWQNPDAWTYSPYPSGGEILRCGAFDNAGNYCNPTGDALITGTHRSSGVRPMFQYQAFMEKQLPVLWLPSPDAQLSAIKRTLRGVVQAPLLYLNTQYWSIAH
ncbi:MAG TPA: ABC transporter substrate-binding protein [Verrucomicrobiae bacterium]|nr:ABC transporter substrate-binding protein [Verrucomicrobiae bacterium]